LKRWADLTVWGYWKPSKVLKTTITILKATALLDDWQFALAAYLERIEPSAQDGKKWMS
jgi:hypothetical protein